MLYFAFFLKVFKKKVMDGRKKEVNIFLKIFILFSKILVLIILQGIRAILVLVII